MTTLESTACISTVLQYATVVSYTCTLPHNVVCRWSPWRRRSSEPAHETSKVCYSEILILMTTTFDWTIQCFVELCRLTVALPVYEGGAHIQQWFAISSDSAMLEIFLQILFCTAQRRLRSTSFVLSILPYSLKGQCSGRGYSSVDLNDLAVICEKVLHLRKQN